MAKNTRFRSLERIYPERFREARLARGLSAAEVASKVGVSRQAISKYETGQGEPSSQVMNELAACLDMPISFFYKSPTIQKNRATTFYRSLKTNAAKSKEIMMVKSDWAVQISEILEKDIVYPEPDIPTVPDQCQEYTLDNIESLASYVRKCWKLGSGPIANMSRLLESHGIIIAEVKTGHLETDACSAFIDSRPFIFLDMQKECAVRTRFNLAHELGHLILHGGITQAELEDKNTLNQVEQEANRFASCFLLPKQSFLADIRSTSLDAFLPLKRKWKVSIQAMVYRCRELEIFSENQMLYIQKQISARRWRKCEPYDDEWPCEQATILKTALKMLIDRGDYTKEDFVSLLRLPAKDIEEICALPEGYFNPKVQEKTMLIDFVTRKIIE